MTISYKCHKLIKFIDEDKILKTRKIFSIPKYEHNYYMIIKKHIENIKAYLVRKYNNKSTLDISPLRFKISEEPDNEKIK